MGQLIQKYRSGRGGKTYIPRVREVPGIVSRIEPVDPTDPVYKSKIGREHPSPQREHPSPQRAQRKN